MAYIALPYRFDSTIFLSIVIPIVVAKNATTESAASSQHSRIFFICLELKLLINCAETARPSYRQNKTPKVFCLTFGVRVNPGDRFSHILYHLLLLYQHKAVIRMRQSRTLQIPNRTGIDIKQIDCIG